MVPGDLGKWYELTYSDSPIYGMRITVLDYRKTEQRAVTRVRDGICAQVNFMKCKVFIFKFSVFHKPGSIHKGVACKVPFLQSEELL